MGASFAADCVRLLSLPVRAALLLLTGTACDPYKPFDDSQPRLSITAAPNELEIQQGSDGSLTVRVARGGGYAGSVDLSVTGLPQRVTVTVTPSTLVGVASSAKVEFSVGPTVVPRTYSGTIVASATETGDASAAYSIVVVPSPNYGLTLTPNAITVSRGSTASVAISASRSFFNGNIALTVDYPPQGITATVNPSVLTGTTADLAVAIATTAPVGNYIVTVRGSAPGLRDRFATLALAVN